MKTWKLIVIWTVISALFAGSLAYTIFTNNMGLMGVLMFVWGGIAGAVFTCWIVAKHTDQSLGQVLCEYFSIVYTVPKKPGWIVVNKFRREK